MLYITIPWLVQVITGSLYLWPLSSVQPSPHPLSLRTTNMFSVFMSGLSCFIFLGFHIRVRLCSICLYLIYLLSIMPLRSIHAITNGQICFLFYVWIIFHCTIYYFIHLFALWTHSQVMLVMLLVRGPDSKLG